MFTWHVLTQIMYFVNVFALCVYLYRSHFYYFQYYVAFVYLSEFIIVLCFPNCCFTNKTFTTHTGTQVFIVERHLIDLFLCRPCTFKRFAKFIQSCKGRGNWYIYICPLLNKGQNWGLMPPPMWKTNLDFWLGTRKDLAQKQCVQYRIFNILIMTMIVIGDDDASRWYSSLISIGVITIPSWNEERFGTEAINVNVKND